VPGADGLFPGINRAGPPTSLVPSRRRKEGRGAPLCRRQQHTSARRRTRRTRASCLSYPFPSIFLNRSHAHGTRAADKPHCARVGAAQHQGSSRSCRHITFSICPVPVSPYLRFSVLRALPGSVQLRTPSSPVILRLVSLVVDLFIYLHDSSSLH
jgi:hypothetical protein